MVFEVAYAEGIECDFKELRLKDTDVLALDGKLRSIAQHQSPTLVTERVMNTPLRKIPFKDKLRVFLSIDIPNETIYCLGIRNHSNCYKKQELNKILTIYNHLMTASENQVLENTKNA